MNNIRAAFGLLQQTSLKPLLTRHYAAPVAKKKKLGKLGPVVEKKEIPVETDTNLLVNYVCGSNIYKTGENIKLKPDSEYPDWLWTLDVGKPKSLNDMDKETKQYWRRLRNVGMRRNNQLAKLKKF